MDYHLKPLGKTCAATGEPLAPGSRCYSVVVEEEGQLVRKDYSEEGWSGPPEGTVGLWRCQVPEAQPEKPKTIDPESMMQYFEQLVEDANPAQARLCYVLALFLLQRRRLQLDGSRTEGATEYLQLSGSHGEGPYEIVDQQLSQDEITRLQAELNQYLEQEWAAA